MKVKLLRRLREWDIHNPCYFIKKEETGKYCIYVHYNWNLHLLVGMADNFSDAYDKVCRFRRQDILNRLCKYKKRREIIKKLKLWN